MENPSRHIFSPRTTHHFPLTENPFPRPITLTHFGDALNCRPAIQFLLCCTLSLPACAVTPSSVTAPAITIPATPPNVPAKPSVPSRIVAWPGGVIPYIINPNLDPKYLPRLQFAVQEYARKTNVRLVPRTNETVYVEVAGANDAIFCGLASTVGYYQTNTVPDDYRAKYNLSKGSRFYILFNNNDPTCPSDNSVVIHEFGHIAGLNHENSRSDRDNYIRMDYTALGGDTFYADAYKDKLPEDELDTAHPYDLQSVMHYVGIFRKTGQQVIYAIDGTPPEQIGGRVLSAGDVAQLLKFYPNPAR